MLFWLLPFFFDDDEILTSSFDGGGVGNEKGNSFWASDLIFWSDVVRSSPGNADAWWNGNDENCSLSRSSNSRCCCAKASGSSCGGDSSKYFAGGDLGKSSLCLSSSSECGVEFDWIFVLNVKKFENY